MAAPSGTTWGNIVGDKGRIGIYIGISNTNTITTVNIQVWFWSKWNLTDSANDYYYDNYSTSATTRIGSVSLRTTVGTGGGWSTANQVKIGDYTYNYKREPFNMTNYCAAKLSGIEVISGTMTHYTSYTVPALASYTVSYNANGGSGAPSNQTKYYDRTLTLNSTVPSRTGYTFLGWSTSPTATSASYYAGGSYTTNASVTLYAVWSAISYKVTYNGNGGTSEIYGNAWSNTATYGQDYVTQSCMFEKLGYEFVGWNEKADGTGTDWTNWIGVPWNWTYTKDVTLYAQWEIKANCRVKVENQNKLGMIHVKYNGKYYLCTVSQKRDGKYKSSIIT